MEEINRNILISLDESENAIRAVNYVGQFLRGIPSFHIFLLHIVSLPHEDYFMNDAEKNRWLLEKQDIGNTVLNTGAQILINYGFSPQNIEKILLVKTCTSIGKCILDEGQRLKCSTVVIGRRGISKKEEFIFGSTSNKILHTPKECTVWIVE
ncbi:MAG: universal stress protein [Thermodesulfovibrionales bacterium]